MGGVVSGIGDAISGAVSGVGDFLGQAAQDVGTGLASLDKAVGEVPGGWGTVAGLAAGGAGLLAGGSAAASAAGLTEMAAADVAGLVASGIPQSQAASIIASSYGLDAMVAADMAGLASQGLGATQIASTIGSSYGSNILTSAATSAGVTPSSIMSLVQKYGPTVAKSLLGNASGQAGGTVPGGTNTGGLLSAGANYFLSADQLRRQQEAYNQSVAAQRAATQQAVQASTFKPIGVTTAFGQSQFQIDPTTGQLTSAAYTATPEVAAQRQRLFGLGAEALPTTTDTQALQQQYIAQQQGLLAPSREQQLAQLRNRQFQRGTGGLATGGTVSGYSPGAAGLMQTNPEMAAYYNALAQQDAALAANAPTYAQNLVNQQIATGTGLFSQAGQLESMAQQPLTLGTSLGSAAATAGSRAGYYGLLGGQGAAASQLQGQLGNIYGQGAALGTVVNPLVGAAGNVISEWLK